jgi:hypothetical protein
MNRVRVTLLLREAQNEKQREAIAGVVREELQKWALEQPSAFADAIRDVWEERT